VKCNKKKKIKQKKNEKIKQGESEQDPNVCSCSHSKSPAWLEARTTCDRSGKTSKLDRAVLNLHTLNELVKNLKVSFDSPPPPHTHLFVFVHLSLPLLIYSRIIQTSKKKEIILFY
jgi:hypothetical protein